MEVIINRKYGGFCLSAEALVELAKKNSCCEKLSVQEFYKEEDDYMNQWERDNSLFREVVDGCEPPTHAKDDGMGF
jgi:hypothetical protein